MEMETTQDSARIGGAVEPRWASVSDTAVFFGVSSRTIWRLASEGVLTVIRIRPRCPRINLMEAEAVLIERGLGQAS
jgi:hypothetical protein